MPNKDKAKKKAAAKKLSAAKATAKIKSFLKHLFTVNRGLKLLSVLLAVVIWCTIVLATTSQITGSVTSVPVTIDLTDTAVGKLGLSVISMSQEQVAITLSGNRDGVRSLMQDPSGIKVVGQLDKVNAAGVYDIRLMVSLPPTVDGVTVQSINPDTISVRFDYVDKKTVPVEVDYTQIKIGEDLICMPAEPSLQEITLQGPASDLAKVERAVAILTDDETLLSSKDFLVPLQLTDGNRLPVDSTHITMETTQLSVVLPVYKTKTVPVRVGFSGALSAEQLEKIPYLLNYSQVEIAGPPDKVDAVNEILVGSHNIADLYPGFKAEYDLALPAGFLTVQAVPKVQMTFAPADWTTKTFNVRRFETLNVPEGLSVSVLTQVVYQVEILGEKKALDKLTADDITCQIDFLDKSLTAGKWNYAATIKVGQEFAWALGSYQVTVEIKE